VELQEPILGSWDLLPGAMEVLMRPLLLWIAVPLLLLGAGMLIAGVGAPGLWIAVITVGIALAVTGRVKRRAAARR
jgi:hypothetical protein